MAEASFSELEADLASLGPDAEPSARIEALNRLAWALRATDVTRANALAAEARALAIEHGNKLEQARAARTLGMTVVNPEDLATIFSRAEEARQLFDEVDDPAGRAASRDFLASLHEYIGDYTGGLELALDALSIAREIEDPIRQGYALSSVGGILAASGEFDTAVERLLEALPLFEQAGNTQGVSTIAGRLSTVLAGAGRSDEAMRYAQLCEEIATRNSDAFLHMAARTAMADIETERGHFSEAERLYRGALEARDELQTEAGRNVAGSETLIAFGRMLLRVGRLDEAEELLIDALERLRGDSVSIVNEAAAHEELADLYEKQGQLSATVEHLKAAQALREQIAKREARNNLAQVEARAAVETAEKDAEIHKLRFVELHAMQSKLVEAEKMALLEKLAAGTAHELNTPLAVLRSNAELSASATRRLVDLVQGTADLVPQATKLASTLETVRETSTEALERIGAIVEDFRRFTQLDQAEIREFDVRDGLESAIAVLGPTISEQVRWERKFGEVPMIQAWPREINHAFMTVLQNAAQSMTEPGVVRIEVEANGREVLVRIRDSGRGMSAEQVAHFFDVAWARDGVRTSMKLGLSAAYTTMQKHGGSIDLDSAPGRGTTVTFRFPTGP